MGRRDQVSARWINVAKLLDDVGEELIIQPPRKIADVKKLLGLLHELVADLEKTQRLIQNCELDRKNELASRLFSVGVRTISLAESVRGSDYDRVIDEETSVSNAEARLFGAADSPRVGDSRIDVEGQLTLFGVGGRELSTVVEGGPGGSSAGPEGGDGEIRSLRGGEGTPDPDCDAEPDDSPPDGDE